MKIGTIEITNAMDWLAADQLFRAELQQLNAELQELIERKERSAIQADRDTIQAQIDEISGVKGATNADGKTIESDGIRIRLIANYTQYQNKRRSELSGAVSTK